MTAENIEELRADLDRLGGLLRGERVVRGLQDLLDADNFLTVSVLGGQVSVSAVPRKGAARSATRDSLAEALEELGGGEPFQRCQGLCGRVQPLSNFSRHAGLPGGRWRYCRLCERGRRQRAKAGKAGQPATGNSAGKAG